MDSFLTRTLPPDDATYFFINVHGLRAFLENNEDVGAQVILSTFISPFGSFQFLIAYFQAQSESHTCLLGTLDHQECSKYDEVSQGGLRQILCPTLELDKSQKQAVSGRIAKVRKLRML